MEQPDWMKEGANELAVAAEALMQRHEAEDHDGEMCHAERAGFLAFLAHRLGVRDQTSVGMMLSALVDYEHDHEDHDANGA
jgi:hypothetical protein